MYVKKCFVPKCPNTSLDLDKIFIRVPKIMEVRKKWCAAVKRTNIPSTRTPDVFCCEDHFNMEKDSENWLEHKMVKMRLRMKKNCLPHLNLTSNENIKDSDSSELILVPKKEKVEMAEVADKTPYHFMGTAANIYLPPTLREEPNASQREIGIQVNIKNPRRSKKIGTSSGTTEPDQNDDEDDVFSETEEKSTDRPNISHDAQDDRLVVTTVVVEDQDETNEDIDKFMQNIAARLKRLPQHSIDLAKMNILAQVTELELEQSWTISASEPYS
ncbi:uncharacterized protein isoform X2 [Leptinotarsa decemlineata]|uniref:uncharacterized protein isoform X2 n=1 Tax=Leptinotarsa decemlineata TaxID=7539 RepID=UPI003D30B38C